MRFAIASIPGVPLLAVSSDDAGLKRSVEFFKQEAAKHHTQYQRMIRRLLDAYAEHHAQHRDTGEGSTRRRRVRAG